MLIRLAEQSDVLRFCDFLRAARVHVRNAGGGYVSAHLDDPVTDLHELRELIGYVITWNALNPRDQVDVVEPVTTSREGVRATYPPGLLHG